MCRIPPSNGQRRFWKIRPVYPRRKARLGRHGRGVQSLRSAPESHRRNQGSEVAVHGPVSAGSARDCGTKPSTHLHAVRHRPDYLVMEHVEGKPLCGPLPLEKVLEIYSADLRGADCRPSRRDRPSRPEACQHTGHQAGNQAARFRHRASDAGGRDSERSGSGDGHTSLHGAGGLEGRSGRRAQRHLLAWLRSAGDDDRIEGCDCETLDPPSLDRVVRTCRAEDPDERWQSAREVKLALELVRQPTTAHRQKRSCAGLGRPRIDRGSVFRTVDQQATPARGACGVSLSHPNRPSAGL